MNGVRSTQPGPLSAVLAAVADGAPTVSSLVGATGLSEDVVEAAVEHLVGLGRLESVDLSARCATGRCGSCPLASAGPSCPGTSPWRTGAPVVALTVRRQG